MSGFIRLPKGAPGDPRLFPIDVRILAAICLHLDGRTNRCHPSQGRIAKLAGCSRQRVNEAVGRLKDLGYLEARGRVRPNGTNTTCAYSVQFDSIAFSSLTSADPDGSDELNESVASELTAEVVLGATPDVTPDVTAKLEQEPLNNSCSPKATAGSKDHSDFLSADPRDQKEADAYAGRGELTETTYPEVRSQWRKILGPEAWRDGVLARLRCRGNTLCAANWFEVLAVYERHRLLLAKSGVRVLIDIGSGRSVSLSAGPSSG
ncbi:helix-turn-helix domain-containing protein [Hyphobacterium sp. SN044]|uniref:helix-turn-helix domain-containing protein n=1 Tax=Hyphobacterium sp. SN044 TaxID=2912575 RepID=UPI0034DEEB67